VRKVWWQVFMFLYPAVYRWDRVEYAHVQDCGNYLQYVYLSWVCISVFFFFCLFFFCLWCYRIFRWI